MGCIVSSEADVNGGASSRDGGVSNPSGHRESPISDVPMFVSDHEDSVRAEEEGVASGPPPPLDESALSQGPPNWRRPTEYKAASSEGSDDGHKEQVLEASVASNPFGSDLSPGANSHGLQFPIVRGDSFVAGGGQIPRGRSYSISRTGSGFARGSSVIIHESTASLLVAAPVARVRRKSVAFVIANATTPLDPLSDENHRLSSSVNRSTNFSQTARFVKEEEMGRSPLSITHIGKEENSATTGDYYSYKQVPLSGMAFDNPAAVEVEAGFLPDWFADLNKTVKIGHRCIQPVQTILRVGPADGCPSTAVIIGDFYVNDTVERLRIDAARIRLMLRDIVLGLRQLHSLGLPHRHLSARNVFRKDTGGGGFAIGDTGLGRLFASKSANDLLRMGYTSVSMITPEMAACPDTPAKEIIGAMDEAHDMWSVGCLCWLVYTQTMPFPDIAPDATEGERTKWLATIATVKADCFTAITGSEDLRSAIDWMLEPHPTDRPSFIGLLKHPFLVQLAAISTNLHGSLSSQQSETPVNHISPVFGSGPSRFGSTFALTPHSVATMGAPPDAFQSHDAGDSPPQLAKHDSTFKVYDEILCSNCSKLVQTLGYFCEDCGRGSSMFSVCMNCFYQASYVHPNGHALVPYVVDVVAISDDSLYKSFSSQGLAIGVKPMRSILIAASELTDRERTILSMTGQLPSTLSVDRRRGRVQRTTSEFASSSASMQMAESPQRSPTLLALNSSVLNAGTAPLGLDSTVGDMADESPQAPTVCLRQGLLSEAAAVMDISPSVVLDECDVDGYCDCMLCNFELTSIPRRLVDPPMLQITVLDLSNNQLTAIDPDVQFLVNLRRLALGNNLLTSVPAEIGNLSDLEVLDLNHNRVSSLPQELMFCDQLTELALDYNDFEEVPTVIFDLPCIATIFLAANPRLNKWPATDLLVTLPTCTIGVDNEPDLFEAWKLVAPSLRSNVTVSWNKIYPDRIIPNLYCGSLRSAQSPAVYERLNIKYLLTVGRGLEPLATESMKHKTVIVDDIEGATISNSFDEATVFIAEAMEKGVGCLVHCFAGMSRSATAVIVYLMLRHGMRLDEAYLLVKSGRPAIHPNDGFFKQMEELDTKTYPNNRPLDIPSLGRDIIPH